LEVVQLVAKICHKNKKRLILNPAPATELPAGLLDGLYLITPNQTEAALLTGISVTNESSAQGAGSVFLEKGVENVIITMGSQGAYFMNAHEEFMMEAPQVEVQDTTAAGDVFNGAMAVALARGKGWKEAMEFAIKAAAHAVTKLGAQNSAPYLNEIS
jgi:ribokinase